MALLMFEGFDAWNASFAAYGVNYNGLTGTNQISTWSGTGPSSLIASIYGGKYQNVANTATWFFSLGTTNSNALIMGFRYSSAQLSSVIPLTLFDINSVAQCGIAINGSGKLFLFRSTTATVLATGTTTLTTSTENYIEVKIPIGSSVNASVRVNGIPEITATGINTQASGNANWVFVGISSTPGGGLNEWDDMYMLDSSGSAPLNDFLGPCRVETLFATAAVSTQWVPLASTNVSQIQETATDGDTSYNSTGNIGDTDLFTHGSLVSTPVSIYGAKVQSFAKKTDVKYRGYRNRLVSGTTISDGTIRPGGVTTIYQMQEDYYTTDPATGLAWTAAAINNSQFGYTLAPTPGSVQFFGGGSLSVRAS